MKEPVQTNSEFVGGVGHSKPSEVSPTIVPEAASWAMTSYPTGPMPGVEASMVPLLTRHAVQVLLAAGHTQDQIAKQCGVSVRTVRRIADEAEVNQVDDSAERRRRGVGRPSKTKAFHGLVQAELAKEPKLPSGEILHRCRQRGYMGGKSAMFSLIARLRPPRTDFVTRFEGLPGEFSQHDFGQVVVRYLDGTRERIHFFASKLKWSRYSQVTVVPDEQTETLVRTLLEHFVAFGGVPLCAVFDRPKTVALKWSKDGTVEEWNPTFAVAALEVGFTAEVCWPRSPRQKGAVENLVGWVKGSFFKVRRFHDREDLLCQLAEWHTEVNEQRPSRATNIIPASRRQEELPRLRAPKVTPDQLALRIPISVGPTGYVIHDTHSYSMPPEAAGIAGTLYLYRDRLRIVAGRYESVHQRRRTPSVVSTLAEHRCGQLAAMSGKRGRRYLMRQHIFEIGEPAVRFLTELVHRRPTNWTRDVENLHQMLQRFGPEPLNRALRAALDVGCFDAAYVARCLQPNQPSHFDSDDEEAA